MKKKLGFTLAEVLITLAIIGIIAALVIPAVMTNFQFRNVGVRLSKFMSTVENSTRAYVVSENALSEDAQILSQYINSTFSITDSDPQMRVNNSTLVSLAGNFTVEIDPDTGAQVIQAGDPENPVNNPFVENDNDVNLARFARNLDLQPFTRGRVPQFNTGEVVLKDGTRAIFSTINLPADYTDVQLWGNANRNPGRAQVGRPVLGITFDPIATGVPNSARRMFGFVVTEQGYVFPAPNDQCVWDIANANWITRQETFAQGACAQATHTDSRV